MSEPISSQPAGTGQITAVVVNYQTPDLLERAVTTFKEFYPDVPLLVVDNGSRDASRRLIGELAGRFASTLRPLLLDENIFHGPALDLALRSLPSEFVYVFDSDAFTLRGGFLEEMSRRLQADPDAYGIGKVVTVDHRGFAAARGVPTVTTPHMLLRRSRYEGFPPFEHHGMPTLKNFTAARDAGLKMLDFPITDYVEHEGRGTAGRFGYSLGLRSKLDLILHKLGL
jgi:hypothetical protein